MIARLLRAELHRSALVSTALALLVCLATALLASSASLTARTLVAIEEFWADADPPGLVQMHTGDIDPAAIDAWSATRSDVLDHQIQTTLPIPGEALTIGGANQAGTVLEPALVLPTERFDLLLDADGRAVHPRPGEIALPVHYEAEGIARLGDVVHVDVGGVERDLRVIAFVRDAPMNPSLVTSKRLVVSPEDYKAYAGLVEPEHLIELKLAPDARPAAVRDSYEAAGLPAHGIAVDGGIFRLMNGLSSMLIAGVCLLVAAAFMVIGGLALRYAFLAAMEEDVAEMAVVRAIGAPRRSLRRLFLAKYALIAVAGVAVGLMLSLPIASVAGRSKALHLGAPSPSLLLAAVPLLASAAAALLVIGFCALMLRPLDRLSPVVAMRTGAAAPSGWAERACAWCAAGSGSTASSRGPAR